MKASKFNTFTDIDGNDILAFNSLTGALVRLDPDTYHAYQKIISNDKGGEEIETDPIVFAVAEDLKKGGFLVDDNVNETNLLKFNYLQKKYSDNRSFGLTIGVTTACNFNCEYCYEKKVKPEFMTREVENKIIEYVNKIKPESYLSVTWYGGEPMLAFDTICRLSDAFLKITSEKKIHYLAIIVTNGYLLNRETALELAKRKVTTAQITIDGGREEHDSRRMLNGGGDTFQRIIDNIKEIYDILHLDIRVNLDKSNIGTFPKLLDELVENGISNKINIVAPSMLEIFEFSSNDIKNRAFSPEEFSHEYYKAVNMILDRGMKTDVRTTPRHVECVGVDHNSYVVDPQGNLYKCWDLIGVESETVGTIGEGVRLDDNLLKWMLWDSFENEKCLNCSILPMCFRGCPRQDVVKDDVVNKRDHCSPIKYDVPGYVKLLYRYGKFIKKSG